MLRALPLLPLALSACATMAAPAREDRTAALGETIRIVDLVVTPRAVIEDSRCPRAVTCVWAGRVVLRVQVDDGSRRRTFDLDSQRPIQIGDGMLALAEVSPGRDSRSAVTPSAYRFSFTYDGLE
jgi:hypothetical protein